MTTIRRPSAQPTLARSSSDAVGFAEPPVTDAVDATSAVSSTVERGGQDNLAAIRGPDGKAIEVNKATINGFAGAQLDLENGTRGQQAAEFRAYTGGDDGPVSRGFIRVKAHATTRGAVVEVNSFHQAENDEVTYYLQMEVLDKKTNEYRPITLSVLENDANLNPSGYRSTRAYAIDYVEINQWLKSKHANLELVPGHSKMCIAAKFDEHNAGGFGRDGVFRTPLLPGGIGVTRTTSGARSGDETDLPLDMSVSYPDALVAEISQLRPGGSIVSRLESEFKGECSKEQMAAALHKMYDLAGRSMGGQGIGIVGLEDWSVSFVDRYWVKDDGTPGLPGKAGSGRFAGYRVDDDGLPMQDPMRDTYMDTADMLMTACEAVLRLRTNKQATMVNVKPGGGRRDDKSGITQRIEVGLELLSDLTAEEAAAALEALSNHPISAATVFNHAQDQIRELDEGIDLSKALVPWLSVVQNRHKFTLKNEETGVEVEISFDAIVAQTLREEHRLPDGSPRVAEFFVVEAELDHLQLESDNKTDTTGIGMSEGSLHNDEKQDAFLSGLSDDVTTVIDPRLHELRDLENASFRSTTSYQQFEELNKLLLPRLFPSDSGRRSEHGLTRGHQKAAAAAQRVGVVFLNADYFNAAIDDAFARAGYVFDDVMAEKLHALSHDEHGLATINKVISQDTLDDIPGFIKSIGVDVDLKVDPELAADRIRDALRHEGYTASESVETILSAMGDDLPATTLEKCVAAIHDDTPASFFVDLCKHLGVDEVPLPTVAAELIVEQPARRAQLRAAMQATGADPRQYDEVTAFLRDVATRCDSPTIINQAYEKLSQDGLDQQLLDALADAADLEAPTLRAGALTVLSKAKKHLKKQYLRIDDDVRTLIGTVAEKESHRAALDFIDTLSSSAQEKLKERGVALGLGEVRATYAFDKIHELIGPDIAAAGLIYDDKVRAFFETLLSTHAASLDQIFEIVTMLGQTSSSLEVCCAHAGVGLAADTVVPTVPVDVDGFSQELASAFDELAFVIPPTEKMQAFVDDAVAAGIPLSALAESTAHRLRHNRWRTIEEYDGITGIDKLPEFPVHVDGVVEHLRETADDIVTEDVADYLRDALPVVLDNEQTNLGAYLGRTLDATLHSIETMSMIKRPFHVKVSRKLARAGWVYDDALRSLFNRLVDEDRASVHQLSGVPDGLERGLDLRTAFEAVNIDPPVDVDWSQFAPSPPAD